MKASRAHVDSMAKRFDEHQIEPLKAAFHESSHLSRRMKVELATATGLDPEQITSWFSRKRARRRARQTVSELVEARSRLQQEIELSQESEAELEKQLRESKKREAELREENRFLIQRITIAEGDKHLASMMKLLNGY